jgi:SAM-dependent methyltransferase
LPFGPASFDAVFAHSLLMHLQDPPAVLRQFHRVLRPGGIVSITDPDFGARVWHPTTAVFDEFQSLFVRVLVYNGASPFYARRQRELLRQAGFQECAGTATTASFGNPEAVKLIAKSWCDLAGSPAFIRAAIDAGWADDAKLESMRREIEQWGELPDAFLALVSCSATGRVASGAPPDDIKKRPAAAVTVIRPVDTNQFQAGEVE